MILGMSSTKRCNTHVENYSKLKIILRWTKFKKLRDTFQWLNWHGQSIVTGLSYQLAYFTSETTACLSAIIFRDFSEKQ